MNRRTYLKVAASTAAVGTLAGCTGNGDGNSDPSGDANSPDETTSEPDDDSTDSEPTDEETTTASPPSPGEKSGSMNGIDYVFEITDAGCGTAGDSADIEFNEDDNEVVVTGTIDARDLCRTAGVGSVTYDESEDRSSIVIETRSREDADMCGQCLVEIDYEARFTYETMPSGANVVHDGNGGRTGVVSAAYGSSSVTAPGTESE